MQASLSLPSTRTLSLKAFASISKPGIIFGNSIAVVGGYFLGSRGAWNATTFLATLAGIAMVIASASAFNNVIDRDIDPLMERTRNRPLANGSMQPFTALVFAAILGILGQATLALLVNPLSSFIAFLGWFTYVILYSIATKRSSVHGTVVGSISGAIPPLVGFTAATHEIAAPGLILFLALCFWQMPHSYAIGIFRSRDFRAASIPLLPLLVPERFATTTMVLYTFLFTATTLCLPLFGYTGIGFTWFTGISGMAWILLTSFGFITKNKERWARWVFLASILIVTQLSLALVFDAHPILF